MSRTTNKITGTLAAALVAAALVPATSAGYQDLRSADARDGASQARGYQDLRSPDARVSNPSPASTPSESTGSDWGDAGIVAGSVLGLALIGVGGRVLFFRRRGTVRKSRTPVVSS